MKYQYFSENIKDLKGREDIVKKLKAPSRNKMIQMFHDYYDGLHWQLSGNMGRTRITRSQKEMWKPFNSGEDTGYSAGQLRVWNIIKDAIDAYSDYARGDSNDETKIVVKDAQGDANDELSKEVVNIFGGDIDEFIVNAVQISSITSVAVSKYTAFKNTNASDEKVLAKISLREDQENNARVELIDPMQIEPLYWEGLKRGYIRFYWISADEANEYTNRQFRKEQLYWEVWYISDDGDVIFEQYVGTDPVAEEKKNVYDYLPYFLQPNKKHNKHNFDLTCTEISDVDDLIELQDDLNAYLTDLGIIHRNVAVPMLKVMDDFIKAAKATGTDFDKVKDMIRTLRTEAGQIIVGPLEKMPATGAADSQMRYLQDIFDQYYRDTRIPRSLLNSDGLSNMSGDALDNLFQSLRVVIGRKRTNTKKLIKYNAILHLKTIGKWVQGMQIEVEMPDIFAISRTQKADILVKGSQNGLPTDYVIGEFVDLLGDSEQREKLIADAAEEDTVLKQTIEAQATRREIIENAGRIPAQATATIDNILATQPTAAAA